MSELRRQRNRYWGRAPRSGRTGGPPTARLDPERRKGPPTASRGRPRSSTSRRTSARPGSSCQPTKCRSSNSSAPEVVERHHASRESRPRDLRALCASPLGPLAKDQVTVPATGSQTTIAKRASRCWRHRLVSRAFVCPRPARVAARESATGQPSLNRSVDASLERPRAQRTTLAFSSAKPSPRQILHAWFATVPIGVGTRHCRRTPSVSTGYEARTGTQGLSPPAAPTRTRWFSATAGCSKVMTQDGPSRFAGAEGDKLLGPVSAGNDRRLEQRIARAANAAVEEHGFVAVIDVLTGLGWLHPSNMDRWRQGRVECLQQAVQVEPERVATVIRLLVWDCGIADLALGSHQTLGHRRLAHEKCAGDLRRSSARRGVAASAPPGRLCRAPGGNT